MSDVFIKKALELAKLDIKRLTKRVEVLERELDNAEIERDAALDRNEELEGIVKEFGHEDD